MTIAVDLGRKATKQTNKQTIERVILSTQNLFENSIRLQNNHNIFSNLPLDRSLQLKIIFLISKLKHVFWVLKAPFQYDVFLN